MLVADSFALLGRVVSAEFQPSGQSQSDPQTPSPKPTGSRILGNHLFFFFLQLPPAAMPRIGPLDVAYWHLAAVVVLAYVARLYGQYHRLRQFKGPATTGFSAWWMILAVKGKKAHLAYAGVNEKYGELRLCCGCCFCCFCAIVSYREEEVVRDRHDAAV